jgi:hypothetical protein
VTHDACPQITFQVQDATGQAKQVLLCVDEHTAQGSLHMTAVEGGAAQQREFSALQKNRDGTVLTCKVSIATVTFTIDTAPSPPTLHMVARAFMPLLETTYTMSRDDQQRLVAWIKALAIPECA